MAITQAFTRASVATHTQPDGSIVEVPVDEPRFAGLRRTSNWIHTTDLTDATWINWWTTPKNVTPGQADPFGGTTAWHVVAISDGTHEGGIIYQALPGNELPEYAYTCVSVWLRADTPVTIRLAAAISGAIFGDTPIQVTTSWQRFSTTGKKATYQLLRSFGLFTENVNTNLDVYMCNPQVEWSSSPITNPGDFVAPGDSKYIDYDGYIVGAANVVTASKGSQLNGGLLIEKAATNLVFPSYQPTISPSFWTFIPTYAINNDDGSVTLKRASGSINNAGRIYKPATLTDVTFSFEARTDTPVALVGYVGTWAAKQWSTPVQVTSQWTRFVCTPPVVASSSYYGIGLDWDNTPDGDYTVHFRNMQVETGREATSLIVTTGAVGNRAADSLVYAGIPTPNLVEIPEAGFSADDWDGTMPSGDYTTPGFCVKESN